MSTIALCVPVYNDWVSFSVLLKNIDTLLGAQADTLTVFAVDDGSMTPCDMSMLSECEHLSALEVITLSSNLGHQRAIAVGLCEIYSRAQFDMVLIADSDGEDRPEDMCRLLKSHAEDPAGILVGQRTKRSEGLVFRVFYLLYKCLFGLLTGQKITFGNFSLIPLEHLGHLVHRSELWNHFAATLIRSKVPLRLVPTERGYRYAGESSMNLISLVVHGLSAISVFIDLLLARLLIASTCITMGSLALALASVAIKEFTELAIPGWASLVVGVSIIVFLQSVTFSSIAIFMMLSARSSITPPPVMFFKDFIVNRAAVSRHEAPRGRQ